MSNPNYDNRYTKPADVDAKIATQAVTDAGQYTQQWKANTAYTTGQIVIAPDGSTVSAITGFTSTSTYSASNWTILSPTVSTIAGQYAPIVSPAFTGVPLVPTAAAGTSTTQAASTAFVTNAISTATTRRAVIVWGGSSATGGAGTFDYHQRMPFMLPVSPTRWRVRVGSTGSSSTVRTTPWTLQNLYIGQVAAPSGSGRPTSAYAATPTQVVSTAATIPVDGSYLTTSWFTTAISPNVLYQISAGYTSTNSGNGECASSRTGVWYASSGGTANAGAVSPTGLAAGTCVLDFQLEYEYAATNLVGIVIGDSITEGQGGKDINNVARVVMPHETWPGVAGQHNAAAIINNGQAGSQAAQWAVTSSALWTRCPISTYNPDFAIVALGTNDIVAGASTATIQANISTIITYLQQTLAIKRIFTATIPPSTNFASGSSGETTRNAINDWLASLPMGIEATFDMDRVLRNSASYYTLDTDVVGDGTHPNARGYQRMGSVPVISK